MKKYVLILLLALSALGLSFNLFQYRSAFPTVPIAYVLPQDIIVEVKTVGELEAAKRASIASTIKGDQGKIIDLISDGMYVQKGQVLVRLDPTPFEEKIEKLHLLIKEQESHIHALEHALEWEITQAEHKNRTALLELESSQLELEKIVHGEGPQEISRLKGAMQKAWLKYEELEGYSNDLLALEAQGFLNPIEVKQAEKKKREEWEAYDMAKQQYESYVQHVYPMQVKKGETQLKRLVVQQEEISKSGTYAIAKAQALLAQAKEILESDWHQMQEAKQELQQTEIVAPAPGMVVLREEYRGGQKRKPRVGDILVKNQPLIDLPDLSAMVVKTRVREVDLYKVDVDKNVLVEVDAYPHLIFTGKVTSMGVLAISDMGRATEEKYFEVHIALDGSDTRLRPGMTARVVIQSQIARHVLAIPVHSIFEEYQSNYCYLCGPQNKYEKKKVMLGISNEQWVEVKEGLCEGECICLLNPD